MILCPKCLTNSITVSRLEEAMPNATPETIQTWCERCSWKGKLFECHKVAPPPPGEAKAHRFAAIERYVCVQCGGQISKAHYMAHIAGIREMPNCKDGKDLRTDYSKLVCPKCGHKELEHTCIGIAGNGPDHVNRSTCCSCGWKGKVSDCQRQDG